jgi:predicted MFS family arabinose efflux permease
MTSTASVPQIRPDTEAVPRRAWAAVVALMLAIFVLVTSEFLPASLLPLMARDFGITEGLAGQVVTATAVMGMIAGPGTALLFPKLDRKVLIVGLLALALVSNLLTAAAPSYALVVVARLALGAAVAGTWAMALAVAASLVPAHRLGRAMMIVNIGVSGATVAAVPLGALISSIAGWRTVFLAVAAATAVALVIFAFLVPRVPAATAGGLRQLLDALHSRVMIVGLIGLALLVGGLYGVGGLIGNVLVGFVADRRLDVAMVAVPLVIGLSIIGFSFAIGSPALVFIAATIWGIGFGANPTMSQTWISRAEPRRIEAAGGLFVFTFQLAIAGGAAIGGILLDATSVQTLFLIAGVVVLAGGALLVSTRRGISA